MKESGQLHTLEEEAKVPTGQKASTDVVAQRTS
jgi:hypothetical protein